MSTIDELLDKLSWNMPADIQSEGVNEAREFYSIKCFFQPCDKKHSKDVWENCANIIASRTDDEIEPYIVDMFLWLEDMNWPGADTIYNRLLMFKNTEALRYHASRVIAALDAIQEYVWLSTIADLVLEMEPVLLLDNAANSVLERIRNM